MINLFEKDYLLKSTTITTLINMVFPKSKPIIKLTKSATK